MVKAEKYCGLTEHQANVALADWLTRSTEPRHSFLVYGSVVLGPGSPRAPKRHQLFTRSLDSIAIVRKVMCREQQLVYMCAIKRMTEDGGGIFEMLDATPAQHVCAALETLNLGAFPQEATDER